VASEVPSGSLGGWLVSLTLNKKKQETVGRRGANPRSSVVHDSVRRGVEPDLYSVSPGRVETLYTVLVPCLIESRICGSVPSRASANSSYR
jgi:hypothetical protein